MDLRQQVLWGKKLYIARQQLRTAPYGIGQFERFLKKTI
jgi:hypothetical protein